MYETYVETCNAVLMGYFGNLEVVSKTGMQRFIAQFEAHCYNGKCWRWDTQECKKKEWQYGHWGGDVFMHFLIG